MSSIQKIKGFLPGDGLQIRRRVLNPSRPEAVTSAVLQIDHENQDLIHKEIRPHLSRIDPPPVEGHIVNTGVTDHHVVSVIFTLTPEETENFKGKTNVPYSITLNTSKDAHVIEKGVFIPDIHVFGSGGGSLPAPIPGDPSYTSDTSYTTYSNSCVTVSGRESLIIDGFLDSILGDYRQLKVNDEHPRRMANDPTKFKLTYEYINAYTPPEIFDGNNNAVNLTGVDFNYRDGIFSVDSDDGNNDYFCTYTFNFFPENVLRMFVEQTLMNLNFVGAGAGGGYITHYTSINDLPPGWDGLLALGSAALAWRKLATSISIWRNWLIFDGDIGDGVIPPGGQAAQQAASDASTYYQTMFETYGAATKYDKFVAWPTDIYYMFTRSGFGGFGLMGAQNAIIGGKYRGMTINRLGVV